MSEWEAVPRGANVIPFPAVRSAAAGEGMLALDYQDGPPVLTADGGPGLPDCLPVVDAEGTVLGVYTFVRSSPPRGRARRAATAGTVNEIAMRRIPHRR